MRVYLDTCSLQRPLDDRSRPRINLEAEAVLTILRLVEAGDLELLSSEAIEFETGRIPDPKRQEQAAKILKLAKHVIEVTDEIEAQADSLIKAGINPLDALHLASACSAKADYFCTCDDQFLKKAKSLTDLVTTIVSPLELVAKVSP
jgi:predicted nucleic acid-binding protein